MKKRTILKIITLLTTLPVLLFSAVPAFAGISSNMVQRSVIKADFAKDNGYTGLDRDLDFDMGEDGISEDKIVIAVIDSGLCPDHPDIDYSHVLPGHNFLSDNGDTSDSYGHGTFVTGLISCSINEIGIDGLAEDAYILPLKVADGRKLSINAAADAVNYSAERHRLFDETHFMPSGKCTRAMIVTFIYRMNGKTD